MSVTITQTPPPPAQTLVKLPLDTILVPCQKNNFYSTTPGTWYEFISNKYISTIYANGTEYYSFGSSEGEIPSSWYILFAPAPSNVGSITLTVPVQLGQQCASQFQFFYSSLLFNPSAILSLIGAFIFAQKGADTTNTKLFYQYQSSESYNFIYNINGFVINLGTIPLPDIYPNTGFSVNGNQITITYPTVDLTNSEVTYHTETYTFSSDYILQNGPYAGSQFYYTSEGILGFAHIVNSEGDISITPTFQNSKLVSMEFIFFMTTTSISTD